MTSVFSGVLNAVPQEVGPPHIFERSKFLWNQQRYLLENIKLSDTKAGFVMTFAAALLSAAFSPGGRVSLNLTTAASGGRGVSTVLAVLGICCLVASALAGAWSIKPRIRSGNSPSPVSWVNVAQYADVASFREAHRLLNEETSYFYLAEQVFFMSRICVTKHLLISKAIVLSLSGGVLLALSIVSR